LFGGYNYIIYKVLRGFSFRFNFGLLPKNILKGKRNQWDMGFLSNRLIVIGLIALFSAPPVFASFIVGGIGTLGSDPTSITAFDSDSDGVPDSAVIGTSSKAVATGISSWSVSVSSIGGAGAFDYDKNGYQNGVVIAGKDIVALDSSGGELWRINGSRGKSAIAADLDSDGYMDEVVVGCWDRILAFDDDGTELWNITDISETDIKGLVLTSDYVIGNSRTYLHFMKISKNYPTYRPVAQLDNVLKIAPIDLEGIGTLNGVVVIKKSGDENYAKLNAYSMYAEDQGWTGSLYHEAGTIVSAQAIDKYSNGKKDSVVFNLLSGAYWVNNKGVTTKIGSVYNPSAVAPIDFDGDGVYDDVIISTGTDSSVGKLYGYNAYGQEIEDYNQSGGVKIVAVDMNFDGKANDAIVAASFDKRAYSVISTVSDTTTATAPITPPATTTPDTTTTNDTTTTTNDTTTPTTTLPTTTGTGKVTVDLGSNQTVEEGTEVNITATATPSLVTGSIITYVWTEGTDLLSADLTKNVISKTFALGTHDIKVVVTDDVGKTASSTVRITVTAAGAATTTVGDSDGDGLKDVLEEQLGTDPNKADTDGDGMIDSEDPNPLVASSGGSLFGGVPSILITIVKWAVIIGGSIVAIIFIREKILDMMWERNQDWSE
jgi:hypothetical protein